MTYIWINPVTEHMYEGCVLDKFLKEHGLERVWCKTDWGRIVKDKYIRLTQESQETVMDARCPMACGLVKELMNEDEQLRVDGEQCNANGDTSHPNMKVANIEPILIHCAREISSREDLRDGRKIITTPCRSLADMGNSLNLKDTCFITWNGLLETIGQRPKGNMPESSPIPPGFFSELEHRTESLTGKESIEKYVTDGEWKKVRLVEMLYCHRGCHNGDGVVADEV